MSHNGDPKATTTVLVGIVGIILLTVVVIFTIAVFLDVEYRETVRKVHGRPHHELLTLQAEQQEVLHGYRWINQQEGVVGIPITRAMKLAVAELNAGPEPTTISQPGDTEETSTGDTP